MTKSFIEIGLTAALALSLAACGGVTTSDQQVDTTGSSGSDSTQNISSSDAQSDASQNSPSNSDSTGGTSSALKDAVTLSTDYGDLQVKVISFETSKRITGYYADGGDLDSDQAIGILCLVVKNISYEDEYNKGSVSLTPDLYVEDEEGITLPEEGSSYDYGKYEGAAAGSLELKKGQTKRAAVFYPIDKGMKTATVVIGDTSVKVPVTNRK